MEYFRRRFLMKVFIADAFGAKTKGHGVFPKLQLSKLSKLAKNFATDQNIGGSRTQALGL